MEMKEIGPEGRASLAPPDPPLPDGVNKMLFNGTFLERPAMFQRHLMVKMTAESSGNEI